MEKTWSALLTSHKERNKPMEGAVIFGLSSNRKWEKCGNKATRDLVGREYTDEVGVMGPKRQINTYSLYDIWY